MADMTGVSLDIFGGFAKAFGAYTQGKATQKAAEYEAAQYMQNAGQAKAVAQREAQEELRQTKLVQSRILALAAAQGGASDPSVVRLIGKQAGEGAYRAAVKIYRGDAQAQKLEMAAAARRYEGKSAARAGMVSAVGSLAGAGMSLYDKYSNGGAPTADVEPDVGGNWWGSGSFE